MIRYVFKERPLTLLNAKKADPQRIGDELRKLTEAAGGQLKPRAVVAAAREPRSVLHKHFLWDDAAAANAYRLDQARELIRSIDVIAEDSSEPIAAYLSVSTKGGVAYHASSEVAQSRELSLAVLVAAERDLTAWESRYQRISDICEIVRSARERLTEKRTELESRAS